MQDNFEILQVAERLGRLDPVSTYPERAAKLVAGLVNATAYRLEFENGDARKQFDSVPPPPPDGKLLSLPLRYGRHELGVLNLQLPDGVNALDETSLRLARWGARGMARGISYISRMIPQRPSSIPAERNSVVEILDRLERTPLTPRERQVVSMLLSGNSTRSIAERTGLTVTTVHTYVKRIFAKLGVHSRVELVARISGSEGRFPTLPPLQTLPPEPMPELETNGEYAEKGHLQPQGLN